MTIRRSPTSSSTTAVKAPTRPHSEFAITCNWTGADPTNVRTRIRSIQPDTVRNTVDRKLRRGTDITWLLERRRGSWVVRTGWTMLLKINFYFFKFRQFWKSDHQIH